MAEIPCPIKAPCLDDANPFVNLSSEAPDVNHFYSYGSGPGSISTSRTTGPGSAGPPPGGNWSQNCESENGVITCEGNTQEEADLCVERLAQQCTSVPGTPSGPPTTPSGDPLYSNRVQTCSTTCADGTPFNFSVAAGLFVASSQILADRQAFSYACRQAAILRVCFGVFTGTSGCVGQSYSSTIVVTGGSGFVFTITNGSLPPGITMSSSGGTVLFSGTPTTPGNYSFTLKVTNSRGNSVSKTVTISVIGFTNANPPTFVTSTPYSFQFTGSGGSLPYVFSISSGTLPAGLTMDSAGLVSGTPTGSGTSTFTVQIADAAAHTCTKEYSISESPVIAGFKICDWDNIRSQLTNLGGCAASGLPAWDGIFNLQTTLASQPGSVLWYFINESASAKSIAASDAPNYPAGNWQELDCFTQLYYDPIGGSWFLFIWCAGTCVAPDVWNGENPSGNPADPSGTYTNIGGGGAVPNTIIVSAASATCCPVWENLIWGVPTITTVNAGVAGFTPNSPTANAFGGLANVTNGAVDYGLVQVSGTTHFPGQSCNCNLSVDFTKTFTPPGGTGTTRGIVQIYLNIGFDVLLLTADLRTTTNPVDHFDFPFNIPSTFGAGTLRVDVSVEAETTHAAIPGPQSMVMDCVLTTV